MRRLLRFGCIGVILVVIIAAIAAVLGPQRTQTGQPPRAIENTPIAETTAPHAQEPTATAAAQPEQVEESAQDAEGVSRGLGLTEAQFSNLYGPAQEDNMGNAYAVGNGRIVAYEGFGDPVSTVERVYDSGVSYDDVVAESKTFMPTDSVFQEQYVDEADLVVHVYSSEWLKGQFPDPDDWINAEPGDFIVVYGAYNPALGVEEVTRWVMATGNNP